MKEKYDVAIIGAGPAGITSAIYLSRANISCCIIEKEMPGGELNKTSIVENYPGYSSIMGPDLAQKFYEQLNNLNVKQIYQEVVDIETNQNNKIITLKNGEKLDVQAVIIAVGRMPKKVQKDNFERLEGRGISFCSLCDGALYKNEDVSILGGGNSALEEALYLAKICKTVTIISKYEKLKGDKFLIEQINNTNNIKIVYDAVIESFNEDDGILKSLTLKIKEEKKELETKACFVFIGYEPATNFVEKLDILDEKGYIIVDEGRRTKIKGIYAAGDVVKKEAFQIVTATSDGALAAVSCTKDIKEA